jgi:ABC-2 type transport system ATP-binding protein
MIDTVTLLGVGRRYGRTWAVRDVDLELSGGVVGLLGPNGAGKTSLLRVLATSLAPSTGRLSIFGWDAQVPDERTEIRRRLGYLPQELGFPRGFTAFAFVDYVAVLKEWTDRGARHAEVRRVLELVDLAGIATKRIRALSGGQRRRLALAQALLGQPRLLVLDEPTTGVDPEQRAGLRAVLAEAARTSVVVLSTHQTEDVAALCERVIVLDAGLVRYDGPVRDLVARAAGRVWVGEAADPRAIASWRTGTGRYRNIAEEAPTGAEAVEPTLEDAYLLLRATAARPREVTA